MRCKPTVWARRTVNEMATVILAPEPFYRRVTLVVPSAEIEIGLFESAEALAAAINDLTLMSQDSQLPLAPEDLILPFEVVPGQAMIARTREGLADLSVMVEYLTRGAEAE